MKIHSFFIILLLIVSCSIKVQNEEKNICYLKIKVDNTTNINNLKVFLRLKKSSYDEILAYNLFGEKNIYDCKLIFNETKIIKVIKINKYYENKNNKYFQYDDSVFFFINTNYWYKSINDFFIFRSGDTIERYYNKFELPPDSLIDFINE